MPDLDFTDHARREMRRDAIPEAAVHHVVGDADEILERDDGRTEYVGTWERRTIVVVAEGDLVITTWERDTRERRRRR